MIFNSQAIPTSRQSAFSPKQYMYILLSLEQVSIYRSQRKKGWAAKAYPREIKMQKTTADDGATISRFQSGEKSAFNDLVERHQQRAYHYASRLTNNADEAADIVSETFLRVYRSLGGFKGESSFTTWLYRIETNCFLD